MKMWFLLTLFVCLLAGPAAFAVDFYVAEDGKDTWSGKQPVPDSRKADGPFATLPAALNAVRLLRADGKEPLPPARIIIQGGTHYLGAPLVLDARDSNLSIEAAIGQKVILSGGCFVTGWKPYRGKIMQADLSGLNLPDINLQELYYNGKRQPMARVPNFDPKHPRSGGWAYNAEVIEKGSLTRFRYKPEEVDPSGWKHPEQAVAVFYSAYNYNNTISRIKRIDLQSRELEVEQGCYPLETDDRFFIRNLFEELDAPGEWYVDTERKILYFQPPDGRLRQSKVVVPVAESAFLLQGDMKAETFVAGVKLTGIAFRDFRGTAVKMSGTSRCAVTASEFRNVMTAIFLGDETHDCQVVGCDISQTGGSAIEIAGSPGQHYRTSGHLIDNNYIYDFGWSDINNSNAGVVLSASSYCRVTHNHIHDGPRFAIMQNLGNNNTFAYNHLHHMNLETCDTGVIYTVTSLDWNRTDEIERNRLSRDNEIHHNLIHDSGGYGKVRPGVWEYPHYSWGIYLDLASSGYHVYDNVVYNTYLGSFMIGGGQDNLCENNIFANGKVSQVYFCPWLGGSQGHYFPMERNRIERNIIAYRDPKAALYQAWRLDEGFAAFQKNLIACGKGTPSVRVPGLPQEGSWTEWQKQGRDAESLLAAPGFVSPSRPDYGVRPDSPALSLGFKPIDLSGVGLYRSSDRYSWPCPEAKVYREKHITRSSYREALAGPRPSFDTTRLSQAPSLDGNLDEWPVDNPARTMILGEDTEGKPSPLPPGAAWIGYDDEALYIAIRNPVPDPGNLISDRGWGTSDGLEIAFQDGYAQKPGPILNLYGYPDGHFESVTQAGASPKQAARLAQAVTYKAIIGTEDWHCEWRIPFAAAGFTPKTAPRLLFNIGVRRLAENAWVVWQGTGAQNYVVGNAGELRFSP